MNAAESAALARADGGTTHCQWCEGSWVAPLEFVYSQASGESAPGGQGGELWRHQDGSFQRAGRSAATVITHVVKADGARLALGRLRGSVV